MHGMIKSEWYHWSSVTLYNILGGYILGVCQCAYITVHMYFASTIATVKARNDDESCSQLFGKHPYKYMHNGCVHVCVQSHCIDLQNPTSVITIRRKATNICKRKMHNTVLELEKFNKKAQI